jgi:hypothetical protein
MMTSGIAFAFSLIFAVQPASLAISIHSRCSDFWTADFSPIFAVQPASLTIRNLHT